MPRPAAVDRPARPSGFDAGWLQCPSRLPGAVHGANPAATGCCARRSRDGDSAGSTDGTAAGPVSELSAAAAQSATLSERFDAALCTYDTPPDSAVDLFVDTNEAQTGRLMVGVAVNSDAGLTGQILLDEQNFDWTRYPTSWDDVTNGKAFRGDGERFRLEAMPGTQVQRYVISFQQPYLWDTPVSLGGSYYDRQYKDWTEQRAGGRVSFTQLDRGRRFDRAYVSWRRCKDLRRGNAVRAVPQVSRDARRQHLARLQVVDGQRHA